MPSDLLKHVLTATGTISSNTNIVVAVPNKRIKITAYLVITSYSTGSLGVTFTNNSGGTVLWQLLLQAVTGSISGANLAKSAPDCIFATDKGDGLWFNPAGQNVLYCVSYFADDPY